MMKRFKAWQTYFLFFLLPSVFLIAGCADGVNTGHWLPRDTTAPTVTSTVPANGDTGVPINRIITATFSETMDPATINNTTFTVTGPEDTAVPGSVTPSGVNAVFTPTSNLADNTNYTATITTGATDLAGNALANNFVWSFTTGATGANVDTTAPILISTFPLDNGTGLPINSASTATFSEPMLLLDNTTFTVKESANDNSVAGGVAYSGYTATFTPDNVLKPNTEYTSTITSGTTGVTDLAGNLLAPGPVPNPWSWTTGAAPDTIAPTVTITSPADNAINVLVDKKINATFSEQMKQATMITTNFTVRKSSDNNLLQGTVAYDFQDNTATFSPQLNLADNTNYTVTITTGAQDLAGNALVPGLVPNPWSFTTGAATHPVPSDLGILAPFAIAAYGGIADAGDTKINGDVVMDPNHFCNDSAVGAANDFGAVCSVEPNKVTNNTGDLVITQTDPDTTTADAVMVVLLAKWNSITMAGLPGGTDLVCGTIGSGGEAGAGIGCASNFTLPPGVYISSTHSTIDVTGDLILDGQGDQNAVFVFQAPSAALTATPGSVSVHPRILLINGAKASNVWWQVGSSATIGSYSEFQGNVLASASISMGTGATSCGRLLSGAEGSGAFTFLGNTVSVPGHPNAPAGCE